MSIANFKEFLDCLIVEELHPELHSIVKSPTSYMSKQSMIAAKLKNLSKRGERSGVEGNMPTGSARAYLKHDEPHPINLDGKDTHIRAGTKVAITAALDKHHDHKAHDGMRLGALQNHAEGGDHWVNQNYRILTHDHENGKHHYKSNKESGIFPPLLDHDHDHHEWTQVGHARDIKSGEFNKLTKTESHPKGISHKDFVDSLVRFHDRNNGKRWENKTNRDVELDHVDKHPLVQKFQDYHGNTGHPPHDYHQKKNLGVFEHPDGSHHIVARDHGFSTEVQHAYTKAQLKKGRGY